MISTVEHIRQLQHKLAITNLVASFNGGKEATRKLVPALSRLMYGPVHFQGPARNEQFKCQNEG